MNKNRVVYPLLLLALTVGLVAIIILKRTVVATYDIELANVNYQFPHLNVTFTMGETVPDIVAFQIIYKGNPIHYQKLTPVSLRAGDSFQINIPLEEELTEYTVFVLRIFFMDGTYQDFTVEVKS